jgi:hypothetical protein
MRRKKDRELLHVPKITKKKMVFFFNKQIFNYNDKSDDDEDVSS